MIKKAILIGALLLGGCANQSTLSTTDLQGKITDAIKSACSYQVTFDTALQLAGLAASPFVAGSPALASFLTSMAAGVCSSVKPVSSTLPGAARAVAPPTYGGVPIRGAFVKGS